MPVSVTLTWAQMQGVGSRPHHIEVEPLLVQSSVSSIRGLAPVVLPATQQSSALITSCRRGKLFVVCHI